MDVQMLLIKSLAFGVIFTGVLGFFFIRYMSRNTEGVLTRLGRETEAVRAKQAELNAKIKEANEELAKRRQEAEALVAKMTEEAQTKAQEEREAIVKKARQEGEEIIAKAQKTKDDIRKAVEKEVDLKAVDTAVLILNEIFSERLKQALDRALVEDFFEALGKVDMEMISEDVTSFEVTSLEGLAPEHKERLLGIIKEKLKREVRVEEKTDPQILGGLIVHFGSLALDGSLRTLLREKGMDIKDRMEKGLLKRPGA